VRARGDLGRQLAAIERALAAPAELSDCCGCSLYALIVLSSCYAIWGAICDDDVLRLFLLLLLLPGGGGARKDAAQARLAAANMAERRCNLVDDGARGGRDGAAPSSAVLPDGRDLEVALVWGARLGGGGVDGVRGGARRAGGGSGEEEQGRSDH